MKKIICRLLLVLTAVAFLTVTMSGSALASTFIGIKIDNPSVGAHKGIQANVHTPPTAIKTSEISPGTTIKMGVYLQGIVSTAPQVGTVETQAGWLMRPGDYNLPKSFYLAYDNKGKPWDDYFSVQPWNMMRNCEISQNDGNKWSVYIAGAWRTNTYGTTIGPVALAGGKTSVLNKDYSNLKGKIGWQYYKSQYTGSWVYCEKKNSSPVTNNIYIGSVAYLELKLKEKYHTYEISHKKYGYK